MWNWVMYIDSNICLFFCLFFLFCFVGFFLFVCFCCCLFVCLFVFFWGGCCCNNDVFLVFGLLNMLLVWRKTRKQLWFAIKIFIEIKFRKMCFQYFHKLTLKKHLAKFFQTIISSAIKFFDKWNEYFANTFLSIHNIRKTQIWARRMHPVKYTSCDTSNTPRPGKQPVTEMWYIYST